MRSFDLGGVEWYDAMTDSVVRLQGGLAHADEDPLSGPTPGGVSWRVLGPIAYADLDGDGDEDAAAGLNAQGGQMFSSAWYLWMWDGGTARQLRQPIARTTRCDGSIESVTAKPDTVVVQTVLKEFDDPCSTSGSIPITYEVAIRNGWPVRVSPQFGPVDTCNLRDQTLEAVPRSTVQLFTSPDSGAPSVGSPVRPVSVRYDRFGGQGLYIRAVPDWLLVTALLGPDQNSERVCGWVRQSAVFG